MQILNFKYRLMPTRAQANILAGSIRMIGWGWNLAVRRTRKALRIIHRGHAGTCQSRLAERMAGKAFVGRRAAKVNNLVATGLSDEDARKAVLKEMSAKAFTYQRSRLAMELALLETESAKQGQIGRSLGSAWAQMGIGYRRSWEACWRGRSGAPRSHRIHDARWIQSQVHGSPHDYFRYPKAEGAHKENWVDLARFFPERLTILPVGITKLAAKALRGLTGERKAQEVSRLKDEFYALSEVRFLMHRPIPEGSAIKDMKITRSGSGPDAQWHLVMALDVPEIAAAKVYPVTGKACGINPARRHAMSIVGGGALEPGVDGYEAGPGRPMARAQKKLSRMQRKLDRQRRANNPECFDEKGRWIKGKRASVTSKKMERTQSQIRALTSHVANQRKESYHQIVGALLKRYDTVYLGDWKDEASKVRRAKKRKVKEAFAQDGTQRKKGEAALQKLGNKMDQDNGLGVFRQILAEKVARSDGSKKLVLVPEPYTTQACAKCEALTGPVGMAKQGWWTCSVCGHKQLRGRTAAWNILQDGPKAELEQVKASEPAPEGAGETPKKFPGRGKGARQALKGRGDTAVGRMPSQDGEGASASRLARGNRKASTLVASVTGLSALIRATSLVTPSGGRGAEEGESRTTAPGKAFGLTAGIALVDCQGGQDCET